MKGSEGVEQRGGRAAQGRPDREPAPEQAGDLVHRPAHRPRLEPEQPLPALVGGDIALTSTPPGDGMGARAQVVRRRPGGSRLRLLDQPGFVPPAR
ncbi:hypothetical protein ACFVIN_31860 [Streptomyces prasinus]|uniref:hypothetical protein n=1 Tax=Streptomyces prasinus TaxID=67345 RepID=UPI0036395948